MKKTKILKKNYEFKKVLTKGKYYSGKNIEAFIIKNNSKYNFLGLAISVKSGKAVKRNHVKRLIRENYKNIEERMNKTISVYEEKLSEVRAGRANPAILNKVKIDYYGTPTPINQVAGVSVPEARLIVIQPWDVSVLKDIEKAILASDIGINPNKMEK